MKLLSDLTSINKAITSINTRGAKLDESIHIAACSVLAHVAQHRDTTIADKLVNAMPKGGRKLALVEFMLAYGTMCKLDPSKDKDAIKAGRLFKNDDARTLNINDAMAKSWTEFKKESHPITAFDAQSAVKALLDRLNNANAKGMPIEHREEALAQAKALVAALSAKPVTETMPEATM